MPTFKEVRAQIKKVGSTGNLVSRRGREVSELSNILWDDESIVDIVDGRYENRQGILVATDSRLIFISKKGLFGVKVEDFPYSKISTIRYATGMWRGSITIVTSGSVLYNRPEHRPLPLLGRWLWSPLHEEFLQGL